MGYGYEVKGLNDPKVNAAKNMIKLTSTTTLPGALLVNDLPFCESSFSYWTSSALIHISTSHP
jgi:hypothetical protein